LNPFDPGGEVGASTSLGATKKAAATRPSMVFRMLALPDVLPVFGARVVKPRDE
jgi:hypothetical protein